MSNATIGLHGVIRIQVERFNLPSGTNGIEIEITDEDGARTTLNLFTRTTDVQIEYLTAEEVSQ